MEHSEQHSIHPSTFRTHHTALDRLFRYADFLNFGEIHIKCDHKTGLKAIIAIHNLKRGSAIGGCRLLSYPSADDAWVDALRLAYMMSLKAAISNLPHGGAKAVIIKPYHIKNRTALMESFAQFVHSLDGRYVTAVDSGTFLSDMDIIAKKTPYVTCTTISGAESDPSLPTALGVRRAIEAAVKFKLGKDHLTGIHVAIQGAGHVGFHLAKELTQLGAHLTMCDINPDVLKKCVDAFGVKTCAVDDIYDVEADVFSPCALGSILNHKTIQQLKVKIVAGSANSQLAHHHHGFLLQEKGILYAPDFVINAGGLIYAASMYDQFDPLKAIDQVNQIYDTTMMIFERAEKEKIATIEIAEQVAFSRLA